MINILPLGSLTAATTVDESLCNKHYEAAIKLKVDTPIIHYFSVSKDATTGKEGRVIFNSGNLQYCPSYQHLVPDGAGQRLETIPNFFRFAPRQIDRVTDGSDVANCNGNVWYDTISPNPVGGYTVEKRKCTNLTNAALGTPDGINNTYHGWVDLMPWGSSCQGKRAKDPGTTQFKPYEFSTVDTKNTANPYGIGPSYYASPSTNNPTGWQTDVKRNNIDTNSGLSRYFDWGYANVIREYTHCTQVVNGKTVHKMDSTCYRPGVWRTLTKDEWTYVLSTRKVENSTSTWTCCSVEDTTITPTGNGNNRYIACMLLYPDDYNSSMVDVPKLGRNNLTHGYGDGSTRSDVPHANKISAVDFEKYEKAGCVFLPSAYWINSDKTLSTGYMFGIQYWSSSAYSADKAYEIVYETDNVHTYLLPSREFNRAYGFAVRLVQDVQ